MNPEPAALATSEPEAAATPNRSAHDVRSIFTLITGTYGLVVAWLAVIVLFGILKPHVFLTQANAANILGSQAVIAVLTLGVLIPMTTGDFDLSVASNLTLSAMIVAVLNVNEGWPIAAAIVAALAVGAAIGVLNGLLTTWLGIDPFIVTLGIGTFANGVTLWISSDNTVSGVSSSLVTAVVGTHLFSVPIEFYYALALCFVIWWIFEYTRTGTAVPRRRAEPHGRAAVRHPGQPGAHHGPRCGRLRRRRGRGALRRQLRGGRPVIGHPAAAARLRRGVPRRHRHQGRPLQRVGFADRGLLPRHRHHRAADARGVELRARPLLRWRARHRRRALAVVAGTGRAGRGRTVTRLVLTDAHVLDPEWHPLRRRLHRGGRRTHHRRGDGRGAGPARRRDPLDLAGAYVTPGLIDSHFHLISRSAAVVDDDLIALGMIEGTVNAAERIAAGVTAVRDCGCRHRGIYPLTRAINAGLVRGPRAYVAGTNPTGPDAPGHWRNVVARDADELRAVIRQQVDDGADWVKLILAHAESPTDWSAVTRYLTDDEIAAGVDEAHRLGVKIGCHCEGWDVAAVAVRAGHGRARPRAAGQ